MHPGGAVGSWTGRRLFSLIVNILLLKKVMKSLLLQVIGTECSIVLCFSFVSLESVVQGCFYYFQSMNIES